jgi:CheY-like chemotaxis protein
MILYLAADLIWATKIKSTAESVGIAARPARSLEMLEARLADSPVKAIVLDLDKPDEALAFIARLRGSAASPTDRQIKILAWGPHVATDHLAAAKTAGADAVLTRGAFDHRMSEILQQLAAG